MSRKRAVDKQRARESIGLTQDFIDIRDSSKNPGLEFVFNPEIPTRSSLFKLRK